MRIETVRFTGDSMKPINSLKLDVLREYFKDFHGNNGVTVKIFLSSKISAIDSLMISPFISAILAGAIGMVNGFTMRDFHLLRSHELSNMG
jgi:hypothetical protein